MPLEKTYLNERIELFDAHFGPERLAQYDAVSRLYNPWLGPITSVNLHRPDVVDLSMYSSSTLHSSVGLLMRDLSIKTGMADTILIPGGGKGATIQQPVLGGLGEASERMLAVMHFAAALDELVFATHEELTRRGHRAVGPDELPLFAPEQYAAPNFAYVPFERETPVRWIRATDLVSGEPVWIPAQLVLIYYRHDPREARIAYPTTGGLVFHPDRTQAVLHGLYEVIERDAINVHWYCRLQPLRIECNVATFLSGQDSFCRPRMQTPDVPSVEVYLNQLDLPVPVVTAIAVDRSRRERAFLGGGGAWSTKERALTQAVFELGQSRTALKYYQPVGMKNIRATSDLSEMTDFFDAAVFFGYRENLDRMSWYRNTRRAIAWDDVPTFSNERTEYDALLQLLVSNGMNPLVVDLNGACWPHVHVTRIFIPQLTQACIPSHPFLGHSRFFDLPKRLGLCDRRLTFSDLNSDPVPFP